MKIFSSISIATLLGLCSFTAMAQAPQQIPVTISNNTQVTFQCSPSIKPEGDWGSSWQTIAPGKMNFTGTKTSNEFFLDLSCTEQQVSGNVLIEIGYNTLKNSLFANCYGNLPSNIKGCNGGINSLGQATILIY